MTPRRRDDDYGQPPPDNSGRGDLLGEPFAVPVAATGTGTSTGTTSLTVTGVTGIISLGSTITGTGVPANTTVVRQLSGPYFGGAGTYVTSAATTLAGVALTFTAGPTVPVFPDFVPIVPPPLIGQGGGAPPTFPPPTPPPIGTIPPGILVGPAIAAAAVPPSLAGIAQPVFTYGSATTPPASAAFPEFTPTPYAGYPNQPPAGVPIVFSNISTNPSFSGGVWTDVPPPYTATTAIITQRATAGPPIGPALPAVVPPRQFMAEATGASAERAAPAWTSPINNDHPEPEVEPEDEPPHRRGRRPRR